MSKKVLYYLNQFFSQIGGEEKAGIPPQFKIETVGPATPFAKGIKEHGEFAGTLICGDNFFNEKNEEALEFLEMIYQDVHPDLVIAGPAFNAGRYGMACAGVAEFFKKKGVPVISGMYEENPGLEISRINAYVIPTSDSAAGMRKALPAMIKLANKVLTGESVEPEQDGYFTQGIRLTVLSEKTGAKRAVDMLLKRLKNEEFETELPMPEFDKVDPAPAVADLSKATIALVTTGGLVPKGNPDHLQSASAQKWVKYDVSKLDRLGDDYYTVHGGFDPVYCNEFPDRVAPLDQLRQFEKDGYIGKVFDFFYSTTGTGTAVSNSEQFGREMGQELKTAGIDAVILTSTWGTCTRCGATIVKEIERFGIPIIHLATITTISASVGANRILPTVAIPYPVGNPALEEEKENQLRHTLVKNALDTLAKEVTEPPLIYSKD